MKPHRETVICPYCWRRILLLKSGRIAMHYNTSKKNKASVHCVGSGKVK